MKLGEWLAMYRARNNLTLQNMADACGFSKAYASMLEKGVNPTTGKPVSPTIQTFEKIAKATGQDLDSLLKILDGDQPITITTKNSLNSEEKKLLDDYRSLDNDGRRDFWSYLEFLKFKYAPNVAAM
ncbi:MAG: helix-turn-helix transcriptional regulator [Selenomonadaceae bacterium]|nr:helix-turn-helix transcriptional regulator [Selenomonadaceae bacterium]